MFAAIPIDIFCINIFYIYIYLTNLNLIVTSEHILIADKDVENNTISNKVIRNVICNVVFPTATFLVILKIFNGKKHGLCSVSTASITVIEVLHKFFLKL